MSYEEILVEDGAMKNMRNLIGEISRKGQDRLGSFSLAGYKDYKQRTRPCSENDMPRVLQIYRTYFGSGNEEMIQRYGSLFHHTFYVINNSTDEVSGFCIYYVHVHLHRGHVEKVATLYLMAVEDSHKRSGLGDALMDESIDDLRRNNVKRIILFVNVENVPAINLYLKHGFEIKVKNANICGQRGLSHTMELSLEN